MNDALFDLPASPLPEWAKKLAVFDLETTGLDLREARIVTACATTIDENGQIIGDEIEWLADPGIEIPAMAASVHGVTTERARSEGRPAAEVVSEIVEKLRSFFEAGVPVVAYNAPYDFTILREEAKRHEMHREAIEPVAKLCTRRVAHVASDAARRQNEVEHEDERVRDPGRKEA